MSLTFMERPEVADGIEFEYGTSLDQCRFLDRLNYISPFARSLTTGAARVKLSDRL